MDKCDGVWHRSKSWNEKYLECCKKKVVKMSKVINLSEKMCENCIRILDRAIRLYSMKEGVVYMSVEYEICPCDRRNKENSSCLYVFTQFLREFGYQTEKKHEL